MDFEYKVDSHPTQPITNGAASAEQAATPIAIPKMRRQEQKIIAWLRNNGYAPKNLPIVKTGKKTAKNAASIGLKEDTDFAARTAFNKAWERLRKFNEISN